MFCLSLRSLPAHRATSARGCPIICGQLMQFVATKAPEVALQQAAAGLSAQGALREHSSAAPRASIPPKVCSAEAEGSCPVWTRGPQGSCLAAAGSPGTDIPEHGEELHLEAARVPPGLS